MKGRDEDGSGWAGVMAPKGVLGRPERTERQEARQAVLDATERILALLEDVAPDSCNIPEPDPLTLGLPGCIIGA